ncbi:MAG: amidinotransferase [Proteobacteria bacterium]|nr:amidinotransferase [Pseudomonadota bacterium]
MEGRSAQVDLELLVRQHAEIAGTLRGWGLATTVLDPLAGAPDACFVEDRAVVIGDEALITRSAAPSRSVESASVVSALSSELRLTHMREGTLDGGDVLQVGGGVLVGSSHRSNAKGIAELRHFAARHGMEVTVVDVRGLHLKCVCSAPAPDAFLCAEGLGLERVAPSGVRVLTSPPEEAYASNVVGWNGRVMVAAGYPVTAERLFAAGFAVTAIDNSEFAKRDGSLTCLSVLY